MSSPNNTTENADIVVPAVANIALTDMTRAPGGSAIRRAFEQIVMNTSTAIPETTLTEFRQSIAEGLPNQLPDHKKRSTEVSHAPVRKDILTDKQKELALANALRYFPAGQHAVLAPEFAAELKQYGRIYMYRFMPEYAMHARPIDHYPAQTPQAAAIMLMIQNNLDPAVAQHPEELITYGGNGAVFQNWAQYRLVMRYLSEMTEEQTLVMYLSLIHI